MDDADHGDQTAPNATVQQEDIRLPDEPSRGGRAITGFVHARTDPRSTTCADRL
jgi:hypothetical protein